MSSIDARAVRCPRRLPRARCIAAVAIAVLASAAMPAAAGAWKGGKTAAAVNIVSLGKAPWRAAANTHYFKTIQAAVNASKWGDWVLIEPGTYYESVKVSAAQSGIWIRGINRNTVIIDGQHKVANGIEIDQANDVWVENLTVRNFDFGPGCPDEECGNEIWWNGGSGSGKIGAHGWYGSYLTAYDTGLYGGYGIFTDNEVEGSWKDIYASGFADSGIYIGACQECDARVSGATMEDNALGYSGSNAGGRLVLERSIYRHNLVGIAPNSENPGDPPPPQDGECGRPNIEHPDPTPIITTTRIPRCTVIAGNLIAENDNLTVPVNGSTGIAPWGAGVELPGDYADLVAGNVIAGNPTDGVLGFEYPNPFTPENGFEGTIFFQLAGNKIAHNLFLHNGSRGGAFTGDVTLLGGFSDIFGYPESHSENNCVSGNRLTDATFPADIEDTWGCQNKSTPNPGGGLPAVEYLVGLQLEADAIREATPPVGQPAPPPQPTMPDPCRGVPRNPLCS
ncbi:MAG: hypothetical protein WAU69_05870 [Solirubrobacteraceae bacterium]